MTTNIVKSHLDPNPACDEISNVMQDIANRDNEVIGSIGVLFKGIYQFNSHIISPKCCITFHSYNHIGNKISYKFILTYNHPALTFSCVNQMMSRATRC